MVTVQIHKVVRDCYRVTTSPTTMAPRRYNVDVCGVKCVYQDVITRRMAPRGSPPDQSRGALGELDIRPRGALLPRAARMWTLP